MHTVLRTKRIIWDELGSGLIVFASFSCRIAAVYGDWPALGHFQSIDIGSTTSTPISHLIILIHRIDWHILVLIVEDVVVQDVIVASLFLEEVAEDMCVLFIRVDSDEATFSLILKYRLFNHEIVRPLSFGRRLDWKWAPLILPRGIGTTKTIELLLDNFR